jgi:hypothetical protein
MDHVDSQFFFHLGLQSGAEVLFVARLRGVKESLYTSRDVLGTLLATYDTFLLISCKRPHGS